MNLKDLLARAEALNLPGVVGAIVTLANEVRAAAADVPRITTAAEQDELEAIHARALDVNARLDAKLAVAERR